MLRDIMAGIYRSEPVLQKSGGQGPDCRRSAGAGATSPLLPNGRHASTCRDSAHYRRQAELSVPIQPVSLELCFGGPISWMQLERDTGLQNRSRTKRNNHTTWVRS